MTTKRIDWKQRFLKNSLSGLVSTGLSLVFALVMFNALFGALDDVRFGFWALMWSVFGMGFVLDMGIGLSVQRAIAERSGTDDLSGMNRLFSTAFWSFVGIGALAFIIALLIRDPFLSLVKIPTDYRHELGIAYVIFAAAIAVTLPLALFSEILHGIQRIDLTNWIIVTTMVLNFGLIMAAVAFGWGFVPIVAIAATFTVLPNAIFAVLGLRMVRGLSVHPRHFSRSDLKSQLGFSMSAYFVTASNKVLEQSDRVIISAALGAAFLKNYQAALKVAEILRLFATQLGTIVSPAAANLKNDPKALSELLMRISRFNFVIVTPVYVLAAVYLEPALRALTSLEAIPSQMWWIGQLLLFGVYHAQIAGVCASRVLIMSGHETALLKFTALQAVTNIALSLMLVFPHGSPGVAFATLLCNVVFSWGLILPKILRSLGVRFMEFARFHTSGALPWSACLAAVLGILVAAFPIAPGSGIFDLLWRGTAVMVPTLLASYPLLRATWSR